MLIFVKDIQPISINIRFRHQIALKTPHNAGTFKIAILVKLLKITVRLTVLVPNIEQVDLIQWYRNRPLLPLQRYEIALHLYIQGARLFLELIHGDLTFYRFFCAVE